jgi:hypothetical protein
MLHNARLIIPSKGADRAYGTADGIFTLLTGHGDSYSLAFVSNDLDPGKTRVDDPFVLYGTDKLTGSASRAFTRVDIDYFCHDGSFLQARFGQLK